MNTERIKPKMNTQRPNWTMQVVSEFAVVLANFTILAKWR